MAVWSRDVKVEWADFERALTEVQAGNGALYSLLTLVVLLVQKYLMLTLEELQAPTSLRCSGAAQVVCGTMARGTHFTCFTGTNVQILTCEEVQVSASGDARHDVYKPDQTRPIAGAHLLYWYKSTCLLVRKYKH